jgi:hypothetical protein
VVPIEPLDACVLTLVVRDGQLQVFLKGVEIFRVPTEFKTVKDAYYYRLKGSSTIDQLKLRKMK